MNPLKTIRAYAAHQRQKGYPVREIEEAVAILERDLSLTAHYEDLLYKTTLFFTKARAHPLYYQIIRKESAEYIEQHEFFDGDLDAFRLRFEQWKRPLE
jgi:hypothetical protein